MLELVVANLLIYIIIALVSGISGWFLKEYVSIPRKPISIVTQKNQKPLEKYTIENLSKAKISPSNIEIGEVLKDLPAQAGDEKFTSYLFSFSFNPSITGGEVKKVTGLINIPNEKRNYPIILMFRGFVDQEIYKTGDGTKRAAEFLANNGFITIAPDFLGYGNSDKEAENIFESRFQTYTTALILIKSINSVNQWNQKDIFLWGHSNGGQIALTLLEITGLTYPTVLWAPVAKPFPYSILYYTDESPDKGKLIRKELSKFEADYSIEAYSLSNYLDKIKAPLQIHQGTSDDAVPISWTNDLVAKLKKSGLDVKYFKYPGADHNLTPSWETVISRDLSYFKNNLAK
ncbi:MAG: alpha/beta fold hydrolase [Patescibacteria group bacterium]